MSELKELVALGDASVFLGHTLCSPRLIEFAEAEEEAASQYLRGIAKAAMVLPAGMREALHARAVDNLRGHPFSYGSLAFDQWALSMSAAPFLAWLLLRIKHPKLTLAEASQLLCEGEYAAKVGAVWSLWGYKPPKKAGPPGVGLRGGDAPAQAVADDPLTGAASSVASPVAGRGATE
jgi:hypothetical protein